MKNLRKQITTVIEDNVYKDKKSKPFMLFFAPNYVSINTSQTISDFSILVKKFLNRRL